VTDSAPFLQSHWGLYRSNDYAETWTDIANSAGGFGLIALIPTDVAPLANLSAVSSTSKGNR
jgi:hypothetical protein